MAEIDTSIYRPQPQPNPLAMLQQIGGAASGLGDIAAGQAVQGAMNPDTGEIDHNRLAGLLRQTVAGSMKAIPTLDALQKLKQAGFNTEQAGLETFQKRMAITHHLFSGLASRDNPTMDDVHDVAAKALDPALEGKKYGITLPVIMNAIRQFRGPDGKPLTSKQIKQKALEIQTQAATTSEILHQHSPGVDLVDRGGNMEYVPRGTPANPAAGTVVPKNLPPTTVVPSPEGGTFLGEQPAPAPSAVSPGAGLPRADTTFTRPVPGKDTGRVPPAPGSAAPIVPRPVATQKVTPPVPTGPAATLRPGYEESAKTIAGAGAQAATRLNESADSSMSRKAILGNLEDLVSKFEPGKAADWTLVAKNFANRNLPVPKSWQEEGGPFSLKSVASQEEFNKLAVQLAQQQFATIGGTGTDAKFGSAFETSPNAELSRLGNQNIIKLLKGNEDAIQAKNAEWQKWRKAKGPDTYQDFTSDFNTHYDPRAFQFKYLSVPERNEYLGKMSPEDRPRFLDDLTYARKKGWIKFQ